MTEHGDAYRRTNLEDIYLTGRSVLGIGFVRKF